MRQHNTRKKNGGEGEDRLSDLPDELLGHILSFLPTTEAGRAAVLSRRWRHVFANVHTLSFHDTQEYDPWGDAITFYMESVECRSVNGDFIDHVNAALMCRRRCVGLALDTSLRSFSLSFNFFYDWDVDMVQKWVSHALQQSSGQEFHLELRLHEEDKQCRQKDTWYGDRYRWYSEMGWRFEFPRSLFSCAALRSLRLGHCRLNPPEDTALPSLETLHLTAVADSEEAIDLLIAGCPRLYDVMLKSCSQLTSVTVLDRCLRRFSLRCCHDVASVILDMSQLRVLDYRGDVPVDSLFTYHGPLRAGLVIDANTCLIDQPQYVQE